MTSDQQCSPVVRYWRKCFCRTEMEMISEDVTRSARFRGSNGEKEMLRHFLENGVHIGDRESSSGDWGSNWRMGFIIWQKGEWGSNAEIRGSFAQRKFRGSRK